MVEEAVVVRNLLKKYRELVAVDNISFEVHKGEVFAFLGPNGAGKTTTVEILECLRYPTSGEVSVLSHDVREPSGISRIKRIIGVLPQDFNALDRLTVRENLELFASMYENPADIEELIELFGLKDKRNVRFGELSGGLKQRVGITAALANNPELIFLDEPTTGLDPEVRRATWQIINDLKRGGKTIFLTTHYMEEAQELADRIAIIVKGKIAGIGTPPELIHKFGGAKMMLFRNGGDAAFGTLRRFFENVVNSDGDIVVPFEDTRDIEIALSALSERGIQADMEIKYPTIEDVFLKLAGFRITAEGEAA